MVTQEEQEQERLLGIFFLEYEVEERLKKLQWYLVEDFFRTKDPNFDPDGDQD